jgi:hypothetical protein
MGVQQNRTGMRRHGCCSHRGTNSRQNKQNSDAELAPYLPDHVNDFLLSAPQLCGQTILPVKGNKRSDNWVTAR